MGNGVASKELRDLLGLRVAGDTAQPITHCILGVCAACRAQPVLTQPQSVFVLPGQTARLSCTLNPQYNISHFGISWFQQRPGHSLSYLLYYNSEWDKHKPAKTPDRFSATKDLASNACILTIASACQDDNGTYYCSLSPALQWL